MHTPQIAGVSPELAALLRQASAADKAGDPTRGLALYAEAIEKARAAKEPRSEVLALYNSGNIHVRAERYAKALEFYLLAAPLYQALGLTANEAAAQSRMGLCYVKTEQPGLARTAYLRALELFQAAQDRKGELRTLSNLGTLATMVGAPAEALGYLESALPAYRALGNRTGEATTLLKLGDAYLAQGEFATALARFTEALPLLKAQNARRDEASAYNNLGTLYEALGQSDRALASYRSAIPIFHALGERSFEANARFNASNIQRLTGAVSAAVEGYQAALALYRAAGDRIGEAMALHGLGSAQLRLGQPQKAQALFQQALPTFRAGLRRREVAATLVALGRADVALGRLPAALAPFDEALRLQRDAGDRTGEIATLTEMASTLERLGRLDEAERRYAQAVAALEALRGRLGGLREAKSTLLALSIDAYYRSIALLLRRGKTEAAFGLAQKTKARSLLDRMAAGRVDLNGALTPEERAQEKTLREKAETLGRQMVQEGVENEVGAKKRYAALQAELRATESQLQALTDTLYARHPDLAQRRIARTATGAEAVRALPSDTALLEYIVLSGQTLALFVATRRGVAAVSLPVDYPRLAAEASSLRTACADPRKDYQVSAAALYRRLLAPASRHLSGVTRLVVCPDGALWDIPFQALLDPSRRFLADRYEVVYAYSATGALSALSARAARKPPTGTLLAVANPDFGGAARFGDTAGVPGQRPIDSPSRPIDSPSRPIDSPSRPIDSPSRPIDSPSRPIDSPSRAGAIVPLPGTQREVDALKRLIPDAAVFTGKAAQEATAKSQVSRYRWLHFATHGVFNDASPLLSSLVLARPTDTEDGFLTAREIFEMDLSAEMAVLSACNTARGVQRTGDGLIGLTWALFVAGCPTQVVSQWAVDDASTATLMTTFYTRLTRQRVPKGAALRQASQALRADPKRRHPYYWAPFVLMGDWR